MNYWVNSRTGQSECLDADANSQTPTMAPPASPSPPSSPARPMETPTKPLSGQPAKAPSAAEAFLNRLQACQPGEISIPHPLARLIAPDLMARTVIKGWQDNRCLVEYFAQSALEPRVEQMSVRCYLPPATLALLTDEQAYEEARYYARTGQIMRNMNAAATQRYRTISAAMSSVCQGMSNGQPLRSQF
ncbi:hypothetical protein [Trichothermofontia sp.]